MNAENECDVMKTKDTNLGEQKVLPKGMAEIGKVMRCDRNVIRRDIS